MTSEAALLDAALTVRLWRARMRLGGPYSGTTVVRIRRHIAAALGCYPAWPAIEREIAQWLLAKENPSRLVA